jgi:hypothetical protein
MTLYNAIFLIKRLSNISPEDVPVLLPYHRFCLDTAAILKEIEVEHPAAKMIVEIDKNSFPGTIFRKKRNSLLVAVRF